MKQQQSLIIGAVIGLLLVAGLGRAEAKDIPIKGTFGGTSLSTRMNVFPLGNPDGVAAGWSTAELTGTLGKRTNRVLSKQFPLAQRQSVLGAC